MPYDVCKEELSSTQKGGNGWRRNNGGGDHCWNGHDAGRYTNAIVSDGLLMQERNPEVHVDVNRPDVNINEQILALKLMTKKLESAHKGQNVQWPTSPENCK